MASPGIVCLILILGGF